MKTTKKIKSNISLKSQKPIKTRKVNNAVQVKYVKPLMPDTEFAKYEGDFFDASHYKEIIAHKNIDVYGTNDITGQPELLLKLRTGVFDDTECIPAFHALEKHSLKWNSNRGAAAGKIKLSSLPVHINSGNIHKREKFRIFYKKADGTTSKDHSSNRVHSNIIGYFDMPDRNLIGKGIKNPPQCRQTQFTRDQVDKWTQALPLIIHADKQFSKLVPNRWKIQHKQASKTPEYRINNTAYSTVTINYNYRSACHKDSGDLDEGFGNLIVLEKNKCVQPTGNNSAVIHEYDGGYLGFPRYGIAVDVRQNDYLAMNVHEWHCNTELKCKCKKNCKNDSHYGRLSLVCYLRKNMIQCSNAKTNN